jgi:hypothetical protein
MTQFETIAVPPRIPGQRLGGRASLLVRGDRLWRMVPALFVLAAYALPLVAASIAMLVGDAGPSQAVGGGVLQRLAQGLGGGAGLLGLAALVAGLQATGVWLIARALDAPRWAAALAGSAIVVAPLLALAPSPLAAPDDAAFGAFLALACGLALQGGKT